MTIGERIRLARVQRGLGVEEAAQRAELKKQQWAAWESEIHDIRFKSLERVAGALRMTVVQLLRIGGYRGNG